MKKIFNLVFRLSWNKVRIRSTLIAMTALFAMSGTAANADVQTIVNEGTEMINLTVRQQISNTYQSKISEAKTTLEANLLVADRDESAEAYNKYDEAISQAIKQYRVATVSLTKIGLNKTF